MARNGRSRVRQSFYGRHRRLTRALSAADVRLAVVRVGRKMAINDAATSYVAFISYSHADARVAKWLHRRLEKYSIPREFRAVLPKRRAKKLAPIFRDTDEFAASSDLGAAIKSALSKANSLIVLCSDYSAKSQWVGEEIKHFREINRGGKIIAVLVGGNQSKKPVLSPALIEGGIEPLAVDLRPGAEAREIAVTRIAAGIVGADFEVFFKRRQRDVFRRRLLAASLGLVLLVGATVFAFGLAAVAFYIFASLVPVADEMVTDNYRPVATASCVNVDAIGRNANFIEQNANSPDEVDAARDIRMRATEVHETCRALSEEETSMIEPQPDWLFPRPDHR